MLEASYTGVLIAALVAMAGLGGFVVVKLLRGSR